MRRKIKVIRMLAVFLIWFSFGYFVPVQADSLSDMILLKMETDKPGNIFYEKEPISLKIKVTSIASQDYEMFLTCSITNYYMEEIKKEEFQLNMKSKESTDREIIVPAPEKKGFFAVRLRLYDNNSNLIKEEIPSFCIVSKPVTLSADEESFFGQWPCAAWREGNEELHIDMMERIGAKWVLLHHAWHPGRRSAFDRQIDKLVSLCRKKGFRIMCDIALYTPKDEAADICKDFYYHNPPKNMEHFSNYVYDLVKRYKDDIKLWKIYTEPDLQTKRWGKGREKIYVEILKAAYRGAKKADSDCVVCFSVSGADFDAGEIPFSREIFKLAGGHFDGFAPHPYSSPRYIGPRVNSLSPEENRLREKLLMVMELSSQSSLKKVLITELGWGLDVDVPPDSSYAKEFANIMVRAHILVRSVPGIDFLVWHILYTPRATEGNNCYGIWRPGYQPLPSAAAYAVTAQMLEKVKSCCKLELGKAVEGYVFEKEMDRLLTIWAPQEPDASIELDLDPKKTKVIDIMGNPVNYTAKDGKITLSLSSSPLFVIVNNNPNKEGSLNDWSNSLQASAKINVSPIRIGLYQDDLSTISVYLLNQTNRDLEGQVKVVAPSSWRLIKGQRKYQLPAGENTIVKFKISQPKLSVLNHSNLKIITTSNSGDVSFSTKIELIPCPKITQSIDIDGNLVEWKEMIPIMLNKEEQILPPDVICARYWEGLKDLSGKVYTGWDENYFYFAAKVSDDKHVNKNIGKSIWNGDSFQIAFDTKNDALSEDITGRKCTYDSNDYEFGFALTKEGPQAYQWSWWQGATGKSGLIADSKIVVKRQDKYTIYEAAIPMKYLTPLSSKEGKVFGFNFVLLDDDIGNGKEYWMGLTPGIVEDKNPSLFKDFVFISN